MAHHLPETGLIELPQIIGQSAVTEEQAARNRRDRAGPKRPREAIPAILPIGKSSWWAGVKAGRYPKSVKFGRRTFWRVEDVRALIERQS